MLTLEDLALACETCNVERVKQCLKQDTLTVASAYNILYPSLYDAIFSDSISNNCIDIVKLLLSSDSFMNNVTCLNTELNFAVVHDNHQIVKLLVEVGGADINQSPSDHDDHKPLRAAIHYCNVNTIKYLITRKELIVDIFDVCGLIVSSHLLPDSDRDYIFKQLLIAHPLPINPDINDLIMRFEMFIQPKSARCLYLNYFNHNKPNKEYYHDNKTMISGYLPLQHYVTNKHKTLISWKRQLSKIDFITYLHIRDYPQHLQSMTNEQRRFFCILLGLNEDTIHVLLDTRHGLSCYS